MESVIQTVLTMIILFGLCFIYLFYRLKLIQSGQSYTQQQNYLLQKNMKWQRLPIRLMQNCITILVAGLVTIVLGYLAVQVGQK